jgi:hypothetical protein
MRKSLVVKLVLLNSVLALSACGRTCDEEEKKDPLQPDKQTTCRGSAHHGGRGHVFFWGGGRGLNPTRSAPGTVTRGGFGSTGGHAAS